MKCICILLTFCSITTFAQFNGEVFSEIKEKNFFKAKEVYSSTKAIYNIVAQEYIEATLENAFNKPTRSNDRIQLLLSNNKILPDSIQLQLYQLRTDNFINLFEYKKAAETVQYILTQYRSLLPQKELEDLNNSYKIWNALKDEPKQVVRISNDVQQKMKIDKAGLKNLVIATDKDSVDFIFDTGANISTVTSSTAKKFNMRIIPTGIEVGTITGQKINADMAVCPLLKFNDIEIHNAIFLVMSDSALYFPPIDYRINGIIGFPIINALQEVKISKDGYFIVPKHTTANQYTSNMALDGLKPLIYMNGMHFTFDSGADQSMLYEAFYLKNKNKIDSTYAPVAFGMGGAAGSKKFTGYTIPYNFDIFDKKAHFKNIHVLKEKIKEDETVYGNIGQDLINQFDIMTLNFDKMYIRFE